MQWFLGMGKMLGADYKPDEALRFVLLRNFHSNKLAGLDARQHC
ncbi:hypothetical protein [Chitinilyticum litopenaei]|nr:hypothetical protein [Chitinilyticum litopenaei]